MANTDRQCLLRELLLRGFFYIKIPLFFSAAFFLLFIVFDMQQINKNELCLQLLLHLIPFGRSVPWSMGLWTPLFLTALLAQCTVCDRCLLRLVFRPCSGLLFLCSDPGRESREKKRGERAEYFLHLFSQRFPCQLR